MAAAVAVSDVAADGATDEPVFRWYEPELSEGSGDAAEAIAEPAPESLCPDLQLLLALYAGVLTRSEEGVRQGLRLAATTLGDEEAQGLGELLVNMSDPVSRFWLSRLDGPRRNPRKAFR
jgi:hypothetical protein